MPVSGLRIKFRQLLWWLADSDMRYFVSTSFRVWEQRDERRSCQSDFTRSSCWIWPYDKRLTLIWMYLQKSVVTTPKLFNFTPNKLIKELFYSIWKRDDDNDNDAMNGANKTVSPVEGERSRRPPSPCCLRSSRNPGRSVTVTRAAAH